MQAWRDAAQATPASRNAQRDAHLFARPRVLALGACVPGQRRHDATIRSDGLKRSRAVEAAPTQQKSSVSRMRPFVMPAGTHGDEISSLPCQSLVCNDYRQRHVCGAMHLVMMICQMRAVWRFSARVAERRRAGMKNISSACIAASVAITAFCVPTRLTARGAKQTAEHAIGQGWRTAWAISERQLAAKKRARH